MIDSIETNPTVADLLARARVYVESSHTKQTLEAYAADWKHFTTWCDEHKRRSLPAAPETIICYLVENAESYFEVVSGGRRMKLAGKIALVTGSDSGIGQAIATTFAREGASVAVHYHSDREGAERTARQVEAHGARAVVLQADLATPAHAQRLFEQATQQLGPSTFL
jgi:hypothetical protein